MRRIPTITKNLLIINLIAFLATLVFERRGVDLNDILGLHFILAEDFHLYQLVTYMFMHGGWAHIFFNMFALWMFGCVVENTWGPKKFLFYYLACGIGAGLIQEVAQFGSYFVDNLGAYDYVNLGSGQFMPVGQYLNMWTTVGASGAIYGILLAFGMLYPEERIFIFPLPIPIKAKWFVAFYAAIELFSGLSTTGSNVAHFAHLGGMLIGFFIIRYWRARPASYVGYGRNCGRQAFDRLKGMFSRKKSHFTYHRNDSPVDDGRFYDQEDKERKQEEVDRILDKIRKSGYDSLTDEERKTLFDASNK